MGNTPRLALLLSLSAAVAGAFLPGTSRADSPPASGTAKEAPAAGSGQGSEEDRATKLAKRKERLEQGAARLRKRAEELRKKVESGEAPAADGKRGRTPEEQAQRLEEQAKKMEERAKNLGNEDRGENPRSARDPSEARERRQKIRKASLNRRWGALLQKPEVIEEFKVHGERTARLKRIRSLCLEKGKDDPQAKRAADLLGKEEERHVRRMKEIQAQSKGEEPANAAEEAGQ